MVPARAERSLRPRLREKLPELLLEAASVVFAVLLALAVDEWRETRSRNALAARARASILEEIRGNATELRNTRDNNRALLRHVEEALLQINQKRNTSLQLISRSLSSPPPPGTRPR
jgi:hypothetical protein